MSLGMHTSEKIARLLTPRAYSLKKFCVKFYSTLKSANQSGKNGHVTLLIGQFQHRVKFRSEILFKGSGPD